MSKSISTLPLVLFGIAGVLSIVGLTISVLAMTAPEPKDPASEPPAWENKCITLRGPGFDQMDYAESVNVLSDKLGPQGWRLVGGSHMGSYACFTKPAE